MLVYWLRQATASGYFLYVYILYLWHEGTILVTPCISLPISSTTAGELLKSLTISNVLQLMDRQSFMWGLIKYIT